jgi:hypothetical protein
LLDESDTLMALVEEFENKPQTKLYQAASQLMDELDPYPSGQKGELAVCHYIGAGTKWIFHRVGTRAEADARVKDLRSSNEVVRVLLENGPHAGSRSPVIWVVRHDGRDWLTIVETDGAHEYLEYS